MKQVPIALAYEFLAESNAIESVYDTESLKHAAEAWDFVLEQPDLNEEVVCETHRILMRYQELWPFQLGCYRLSPVYIGGREALNHFLIQPKMDAWCTTMNRTPTGDLEAISKSLHVVFEHIHPFIDGNGRTGRIFMNWYRLRNDLPLLIIHKGREQREYYKWFDSLH